MQATKSKKGRGRERVIYKLKQGSRKCGNVHFIAEIYSYAETRRWFMHVLALRAAAEVAAVQLCEGILELNSYWAAIKYIYIKNKREMYVVLYINYTNILCICVCLCVCHRNGLSSHKCYNYLHARLSSISICRDCSKSLWRIHLHIHTHLYLHIYIHKHAHTYALPYTHLPCLASPCIQVKCTPYAFMLTLL